MAQAWDLEAARRVLHDWCERRVSEATQKSGLGVQFEGVEAWLLAQSPNSLAEAERVLAVMDAFEAGRTEGLDALAKGGGAHRRDGAAQSRVSRSFAPCAYGPMGGRA